MACRYIRNEQNEITSAIAPNGETSKLYESLTKATGNTAIAKNVYEKIYSPQAKQMYGLDFEQPSAVDSLYTDKNGEPILAADNGFYYILGPANKIALEDIKITTRQTTSNLSYEKERALLDTAVSFVNDLRGNDPTFFDNPKNVKRYFTQEGQGKGLLAGRIAAEVFNGLEVNEFGVPTAESIAIAENLAKIGSREGFEAMVKALPEGVTLDKNGNKVAAFLNMYTHWDDVVDRETGNLLKKGYRTAVADALEDFGMRLKDDEGQLYDIDDTPIRIHDKSRLEENPRDKLSLEVKALLSDIRYKQDNIYGYKTAIPLDEIYSDIAESSVNKGTVGAMLVQLKQMAKYKDYLEPVVTKLNSLSAKEQAAFYSNFSNSYKDFIQFRTKVVENVQDGQLISQTYQIEMFASNRSNAARRERTRWARQSRQVPDGLPNERALYNVDENNNVSVIPGKLAAMNAAFSRIDSAKKIKADTLTDHVNDLGDVLWNMSIEYGPTLEAHKENLQRYFKIGDVINGKPIKGKALFTSLVYAPNKLLNKAVSNANKNVDLFDASADVVKLWAGISPYFVGKKGDSFYSGGGKTYYPISQITPLDEIVNEVQSEKWGDKTKDLKTTPLFSPTNNFKHNSVLLGALSTEKNRNNFKSEVLDSSKFPTEKIGKDYEAQNEKVSLIARLNAFANNRNPKNKVSYFKLALSVQADRKRMDFITIPRIETYKLSPREIIKGFIVQDLMVMNAANTAVDNATSPADLIEGYHYKKGSDYKSKDGPVFTMPQISFLNYNRTLENNFTLMEAMDSYAEGTYVTEVETILDQLADEVFEKLDTYEASIKSEMQRLGIQNNDLHKSIRTESAIKNFVLNDFYGRIEVNKLLRGGMSFMKNASEYYKRMGLVNTPGKKLLIQGDAVGNPDYGMLPRYNSITIKQLDFQDPSLAGEIAENIKSKLIEAGVNPTEATEIANEYRSVTKTDAQSFISVKMYRAIQQGLGSWDVLDEQAYRNHEGIGNPEYDGKYVDNQGNARPLYPIKPYHEELTVRKGTAVLHMDKNSYVTVTKDLAAQYPVLEKLRGVMERGVHVVHEENATKGARVDVRDAYTDTFDNFTMTSMDGRKLRLPQITPTRPTNEITFSRQIRKNIIANWGLDPSVRQTFQNLIAENVKEDTIKLEKELGLTALRNAKTVEARKNAKLQYLKNLRSRLQRQLRDKGLPDTYLGALDIVPNGPSDYRFAVPLAFPNYQAKFEQIFFSLYNNGIFVQKVKGKNLVQIAEVGGHAVDSELKMYDGTSEAEIMMRASDLGFEPGTKIEDVKENDPRLFVIGYRIPNQGKNSMLPMKVKRFLPESHAKGIVVPGGVTKQMGSDFDLDKMMIVQKETKVKTKRQERDNKIFDIMFDALKAKEHMQEVMTPLDAQAARLEAIAAEKNPDGQNRVDYNSPLAEIDMEMRNKAGIRLRGAWANALAGHNIAQLGDLMISENFAPIIDGEVYDELGSMYEADSQIFANTSISAYLSAAVDAANKPIQVDINDNEFTVPVAAMMLSTGIPVETVIEFLTQPSVLEVIQHARDNGYHPGLLGQSIKAIKKRYPGEESKTTSNISTEELRNKEIDQRTVLNNFAVLHRTGVATTRVFKIITPDNLSNVNEISALRGWLDTEAEYLKDSDGAIILGAEEFINENIVGEGVSPMEAAYRGIFDTMLVGAETAGFINNRPAFYQFKELLKYNLHQTSFDAATQKFIDRALFLQIMANEESPLADYMSKDRFEKLYKNPNNNIATRFEGLKRTGKLANNLFFSKLEHGNDNFEQGSTTFTIKLNTDFDTNVLEKNALTEDFRRMLTSSDPQVREFAQDLIANQLMTSGFHPAKGSYADLIPSEAFTTSILNEGMESPVMFFESIQSATYNPSFFDSFVHDFIRNFGTSAPGGSYMLPFVRDKNIKSTNTKGLYRVTDPTLKRSDLGYPAYFISTSMGQEPKIYVRHQDNVYGVLQLKGNSSVNEVGNKEQQSSINTAGTTALPGLNTKGQELIVTIPKSVNEPAEIAKVCRI